MPDRIKFYKDDWEYKLIWVMVYSDWFTIIFQYHLKIRHDFLVVVITSYKKLVVIKLIVQNIVLRFMSASIDKNNSVENWR